MKRKEVDDTLEETVEEEEEGIMSENSDDDEEDSSEEEDQATEEGAPKAKVQRTLKHEEKMKHGLYRPLTSEELNQLKETENLFKSSLFRMQITELLSEVKLKKARSQHLDEVLHSMNRLLMSLPDGKEIDLTDLSLTQDGISVPLASPPGPLKGKFQFKKPHKITVIGSYLLETITKPNLNVDVAVQLPKECLQDKDCINMKYVYKRALYLAELGKHLKKSQLFSDVRWSHSHGDVLRPILVLTPEGKAGSNFCIHLHTMLPEDIFKQTRFSPDKNNIRKHWYRGEASCPQGGVDMGPGTPHYNTSILSDMVLEEHLHLLYNTTQECPAAKDAIVLFKVWLHQRQLDKGHGSFSGFIASMLVGYLLSKQKINKHMSSYQILRVLLQFISSTDWMSEGITMLKNKGDPKNTPDISAFHSSYEVVFVDSTGYLNLCSNLSSATYYRVKEEATLSMEYLNSRCLDAFDMLFMRPVPFVRKYDHFIRFQNPTELSNVCRKVHLEDKLMDRADDLVPVLLEWMIPLLKRGLGKRVKQIGVHLEPVKQWPLNKGPPDSSWGGVTLGLQLDTEHAGNILDLGPAADSPEAQEFRTFWGNKSELRRFQDSSVREAVVWQGQNAAERRMICEQVVKHLLKRHGNVDSSKILYIGDQLDPILQQHLSTPVLKSKDVSGAGTGEEEMQVVIQTFDALCKDLRSLNLPLSINTIQGIDPVFRASEVHPPVPHVYNKSKGLSEVDVRYGWLPASNVQFPSDSSRQNWNPILNVILQFETSGQWPDDLQAIQNIKAAFHVQLGEQLRSQCSLVSAASAGFVDVMKDGFVFRIKVKHYREMVLCQESLDEEQRKQADQLKEEIVDLPLLTSTLHGIQQQFHSYAATVRLAKRWVAAQMLSGYISDESSELIVTSLFLEPAPYTIPGSHIVGLLRFLNKIASFDWQSSPLIVNLNNTFTAEDYHEITTSFKLERTKFPPMFIATSYDKTSSQWTRKGPSSQILSRLVILARESCALLEKQLRDCGTSTVDFKQIFRPPLDDYDVIISLRSKFIARHNEAIDSERVKEHASHHPHGSSLPVAGFDPVKCYIKELQEAFSDIALFFYDACGGDIIGVVWKPHAFTPSQFKVLNAQYTIPLEGMENASKGKKTQLCSVVPNIPAILSDFKVLGDGLVSKVDLQCS